MVTVQVIHAELTWS